MTPSMAERAAAHRQINDACLTPEIWQLTSGFATTCR